MRIALRHSAPVWMIALLIGGGLLMVRQYVEASPAFTVTRIVEPAAAGWRRTLALDGLPLLQVNAGAVASQLERANPQMRFVRVTRRWPSTIVIDAEQRQPIAQLHLREYLPMDAEGFVFAVGTPAPQPSLPVIDGIEAPGQTVTPGTLTQTPRAQLALQLLTLLRNTPALRQESVALLNMSDAHQITFRLRRGIEVRIGEVTEMPKRLERLGPILAKLQQQGLTPQYIDLRFADPVIGPR